MEIISIFFVDLNVVFLALAQFGPPGKSFGTAVLELDDRIRKFFVKPFAKYQRKLSFFVQNFLIKVQLMCFCDIF